MSLEQKIAELIDALNANTAALNGTATQPTSGGIEAVVVDKKNEKKATAPKAVKEEKAAAPVETKSEAAPAVQAGDEPDLKDPNFAEVQKLVLDLIRSRSRDIALSVLGQFGASKASDMSQKHYKDFINAANEVLLS